MTNYGKLKVIIAQANRQYPEGTPLRYELEVRILRLADVLLALESKLTLDYIISGNNLEFIEYNDDEPNTAWFWNLKEDSLDKQSEETIKFLTELLCG